MEATKEKSLWRLMPWRYKLAVILACIAMPMILGLLFKRGEMSRSEKEREKMKYFIPTIRETFWGKRVDWSMRETPLTDEQLDELFKTKKA